MKHLNRTSLAKASNPLWIWLSTLGISGLVASQAAGATGASAEPAAGRAPVRVALYKGTGTGGAGPTNLMARLNHAPDSSITSISPEDIQAGVLTNYDVIIFAGGSGSKEAATIGEKGREAVRRFVAEGGGYVGICAGAYLATSGYSWSLHMINARTVSTNWQRGRATLKLEMTPAGRKILGEREGQFDVIYHNGPVVKAANEPDLPAFDSLAFFRTEVVQKNAPQGDMINTPAIFSARYQRGKVVCISPHPEQTPGLEDLVPSAVKWVTDRDQVPAQTRKPAENAGN